MTVKKNCEKCKEELVAGAQFCTSCGHKVGVPVLDEVTENGQLICPKCKRKLPPGNSFCIHCGQSVDVSNAQLHGTELRCNKCNIVLNPEDAFCTGCGQKTNFIVRSTSASAPTNAEVLNLPSASQGKPLGAANIFGYNLTEDQMVDEIIKKEIAKSGEVGNCSIAVVEKKKNIFSIIYSVILFICLSLFFFHSHTGVLIFIFVVITLTYIGISKNYNLIKYLHKEIKARPDEKIGYIVSTVISGKVNSGGYKLFRLAIMLVAIALPMFIFKSPHTIYEHDSELDGYVIRFYTIGWLENDKELEIPAEYKGEPVVGIRGEVFANVLTLRKVTLPDTIKEIRGQAFQYAYNLEKINIPDGISEIKGNTFQGCDLKEITIPDSVTRIGGHAFRGNASLKKVNISPNSKLKEIGSSAFRECYQLDEIYLPRGVFINERAFKNSGTNVKEYYGEDGVVLSDKFDEEYSYMTSAYLNIGELEEINTYRTEEGIEGLTIRLDKVENTDEENIFVISVFDGEGARTFLLYREVPYKTLDDYGITVYIDSDYLFDYTRTGVSVVIYYN